MYRHYLEPDMQGKTFFSLPFAFQMPNHYDLDCPTAPIPCTFSVFGCHENRDSAWAEMGDYP